MPVVKVRASKSLAKGESLLRKVSETTGSLLVQNDRVLVVYGKETASIYYEDSERRGAERRAS